MSFAAEAAERQWEAGYSALADGAVCADCVGDPALAELVAEGEADECSFCGRSGENLAADIDTVLHRIGSQLMIEWTRSENVLYHDSEEETGYAGPVYGIRDVLELEGAEFGNEDFEEFVVDAFSETQFSPTGVYAITEGEALRFGWEELVETVKHQQRFFFVLASNDRRMDGAGVPVPRGLELLGELYRLITEYDLMSEVGTGTPLFRARVHSVRKRYSTAKDLGAPPPAFAAQSRMSPAGIPMLYTAENADAAVAETLGTRRTARKGLTVATFRPTSPLRIVDFSRLPAIPSVFDPDPETPRRRHELGFLHGMRRAIGREVVLDGREHIDYVPTQVVCEYLRHQAPDHLEAPVHGLAWESTRLPGSRNVVLFLEASNCVDAGGGSSSAEGPMLELSAHEFRRIEAAP